MIGKILLLVLVLLMGIVGSFYFYYTNQYIVIIGTVGVTLVIIAGIVSWIGATHGRRGSRRRR